MDRLNCTARVTVPVLMPSGRYDLTMILEAEVEPMFDMLGTTPEHTRLIACETDHWIDRREVARGTAAWLDRYPGLAAAGR